MTPACTGQSRSRSGGGGIRTLGPGARSPVFKTGAFDHSATPPGVSVAARAGPFGLVEAWAQASTLAACAPERWPSG